MVKICWVIDPNFDLMVGGELGNGLGSGRTLDVTMKLDLGHQAQR